MQSQAIKPADTVFGTDSVDSGTIEETTPFAVFVHDDGRLPTGPPPIQALVSLVKDKVVVQTNQAVVVPKTIVDSLGRLVTFYETTYTLRTDRYNREDVDVRDTHNRKLDTRDLAKLLKIETPALLAVGPGVIDPLHLRLIKEGTLILAVPQPLGPLVAVPAVAAPLLPDGLPDVAPPASPPQGQPNLAPPAIAPQARIEQAERELALARAGVVFNPGEIDFGLIHQGQSPGKFIDVVRAGNLPWSVSEIVKSSAAPFVLKVDELKSRPTKGYRIHVRVNPDAPVGAFKQEVILKTNDPASPTLTFNVLGNVQEGNPPVPLLRRQDRDRTPAQKAPTRIGMINIVGNNYTPSAMIRENLALYPGQVLNPKDLREAQEKLARLNTEDVKIFATVQVLDPSRAREYQDILVQVSETLSVAISTEMKNLEGPWIVTAASIQGNEVSTLKGAEFTFSGNEIATTAKNHKSTHSFLLNPSSDPKGIRCFPIDGPPGAGPAVGSYELRGDSLKLRLRPEGAPNQGASSERVMELTLKRKTAKEP